MEHFYNKTTGENWFNYPNLYKSMVDRFPHGSHFVEVGVWKGMSACFMAVEIINAGKDIKFDCVDTWAYVAPEAGIAEQKYSGLYETFLANIAPVKERITTVRELSWDGAARYKDASLDFVFIDAAHDYASVVKDLNAWYPKLKKGGVLAGHDYRPSEGVFAAVNDFFKDKHEVACKETCWVVEVV
jgi:predicted O-methyltransferase YrrM